MTALAVGDTVMFRSTFAGTDLFRTNLLHQPPLLGRVIAASAGVSANVLWNNGKVTNSLVANVAGAPDAIPVLKALWSTNPNLPYGEVVRSNVNNQCSWFIGAVYATLLVQTVPVDGVETDYIEHVIVRTANGMFWIAPASEIEVVPGQ